MKRTAVLVLILAALAFPTLAQDATTAITTLDGTLLMIQGSDGQTMARLSLADGQVVAIDLPKGEITRLRLRDNEMIRISGVFIGATAGTGIQSRILARTMTREGTKSTIRNPVKLTQQDRLQIRAYAEEQLKTQTQTQTQAQAQAKDYAGDGAQGGGADGAGGAQTGKK